MNHAWIKQLSTLLESKTPFVISTITKFIGSAPRKVEAKMITYLSHGRVEIFDTIGGGKFEKEVMEDAVNLLKTSGTSFAREYALDASNDMACGGRVEVFHEITTKRADLYIFGAGHVAQAIARVLEDGPFTVHLIDERSEWALSEKAPESAIRHHQMWDQFVEVAHWDADSTYVMIMTHDHKHDGAILKNIINRDWCHLGLMGSASKWASVKKEMLAEGFTAEALARVNCPIGEKNLGRGPTEIAIGVARELLLCFHQ